MKGAKQDALQMKKVSKNDKSQGIIINFSPHKASVSLNPTSVSVKVFQL